MRCHLCEAFSVWQSVGCTMYIYNIYIYIYILYNIILACVVYIIVVIACNQAVVIKSLLCPYTSCNTTGKTLDSKYL